jgi:hypothetical protein
MRQSLLVLVATLFLHGCATAPVTATRCVAGANAAVQETLYFGTARVGADPVSEAQWLQFLEHDVTPRFPDGLTWWNARGQWRDAETGLVEEKSFVLQIIHRDDADESAKVEALIAAYKKQFAQQAVLSTRVDVCSGL